MPTFFRPARPSRRVVGGRRPFIRGNPIYTIVGVAAGAASVTGVGVAIIAAIGSTAGVSSVDGIGVAIRATDGTAAGVASCTAGGVAVIAAAGSAAGASDVSGSSIVLPIISTRILHKPVDYVLAGQQMAFKRGTARGAGLRHAFNE